jgi:hypothetical protein
MISPRRWSLNGILLAALAGGAVVARGQAPAPSEKLAAYRHRILGVYSAESGDPIEGADVVDLLSQTTARTTKTGTVTLSFLPEGGNLVRIQKIGFTPVMLTIAISPSDTVPLTIILSSSSQTLPTVVTTDSTPKYVSPGLRGFEERRQKGAGHFIDEAELRKNDSRKVSNLVRNFPGLTLNCPRAGLNKWSCFAVSTRQKSRLALSGGVCLLDIYINGAPSIDNDLEKLRADEFSGIEYYAGGASIPMQYNRTGSSCGVILLWTRER